MKLLMITRKVDRNDHLAGFIYRWVEKLAGQVDELRVITWQEGDIAGLPANVKITQLKAKQNKLIKLVVFKWTIWKQLKDVDGVFCHQMPIYTIIAAPLAKLRGKKVVSWYTHQHVDWRVWLMNKLTDVVLSASKESFRLPTNKLVITGHGIDLERFSYVERPTRDTFNIISIGRISPTKDYESMIKAVDLLSDKNLRDIKLSIVGAPGLTAHEAYLESLEKMVSAMQLEGRVTFIGPRPHTDVPELLHHSDVFINMSGTGSLDKAVLEAMATGCLVITANEAFASMLPAEMRTERDNPVLLSQKIENLLSLPESQRQLLRLSLRQIVVNNHNLDDLVKKIIYQYGKTN